MMKMMIHENQAEWSSSALVDQESIRAVVNAFASQKASYYHAFMAFQRPVGCAIKYDNRHVCDGNHGKCGAAVVTM
jgi:hypothetical protein